jgi:hypothetical protein
MTAVGAAADADPDDRDLLVMRAYLAGERRRPSWRSP